MSLDVNFSEPEEFNSIELYNIVKDLAKLINVEEIDYNVDFISGKGDNYIANLFRLTVNVKSDDGDNVIKLIVKTLINTVRQELFNELHKREVFVYREVISKFEKILKEFDDDKNFKLAKCYMSSAEPGREVIVLEDLEEIGYQIDQNKYELVDYDHACLIFRKLAKFHALSFILENRDPETYERLKSNCMDIIFDDDFLNRSKLKDYFTNSFNTSVKFVIDNNARNRLQKVAIDLIERLKGYVKSRKYSVLCHGDFWINNILFKRENEKPTDAVFLDFQAMRFASPVTDIMYFTYLCTSSEFRCNYFEELQDIYYNTLKIVLSNCDVDVCIVYPRNAFDEDIKEFTNFGFLTAMTELKIMTMKPEDENFLENMKVGEEIDDVRGELRLHSLRVNQMVDEFIKNDNFDKL